MINSFLINRKALYKPYWMNFIKLKRFLKVSKVRLGEDDKNQGAG